VNSKHAVLARVLLLMTMELALAACGEWASLLALSSFGGQEVARSAQSSVRIDRVIEHRFSSIFIYDIFSVPGLLAGSI
jgi:hypothetical protein